MMHREDNDGKGDEASSFSGSYVPPRKPAIVPDPGPSSNLSLPLTTHDLSHPSTPLVVQGLQSNIAESFRRDRADSPTYDGDVESSTTGCKDPQAPSPDAVISLPQHSEEPSTPCPPSWRDSRKLLSPTYANEATPPSGSAGSSRNGPQESLPCPAGEPKSTPALASTQIPSVLTADDIQAYVRAAIDHDPNSGRTYRPKSPPKDRPVRVYADGVYDIFHFGHALQLRQAKLSFPSVYLMVGVCSDELCSEHKSRTVMNHAERCESVRHCRWVDEIVPDAPWVVDQAFLDKHRIDYVAHDDDPYKGSDGSDDVYHYVKMTGQFIPTRRTPGVSTSELLERIVAGYREGDWDAKLVKIGHPELTSRAPSRATSRPESRLGITQPLDGSRVDDNN
ncbi:hypothetical protein FS837_006805 [Tulasnella sp. UAMH 9824]|nr:hypothetical protein FS837_006805 [Tulasnella sp. UAMH 9824]